MRREMKTSAATNVPALAMGMSVLPIVRNYGIARSAYGHPGSPKRNQERAIKRMAQRSRAMYRNPETIADGLIAYSARSEKADKRKAELHVLHRRRRIKALVRLAKKNGGSCSA